MKKLVCDRCGVELTDKDDIDIACEGQAVWEATARARGAEARGIIPCTHFIRCGGEMVLVVDSKIAQCWQRLKRTARR
ncbi:MAG: hypothetical protein HYY41_06350 [Chloroflexi bacterium]|nr:hypothetical protein [Chloroflexota bacterium]MBI2980425.1 hypothetical protein [Chloroflexota bacterium]